MKSIIGHVEATISRIKKYALVTALVFLGSVVIAFAAFTDATTKLFSTVSSVFWESPISAREKLSRLSLPYTADAFVRAAQLGNLHDVRLFLAAGMDPNAKDGTHHATALSEAVRAGHVDIVRELVHAKARIGSSDLDQAASKGDVDLLKALLRDRQDVVMLNSAFIEAARGCQREVMQVLLKEGASIESAGEEALRAAAGAAGNSDSSAQAKALEVGKRAVVVFLLDRHVDPKVADERGWTPLHLAARSGDVGVVMLLLDQGADPNAVLRGREEGWTPLMVALYRWNGKPVNEHSETIARELLAKGADVNVRAARGKTPLMLAVNCRNAKIVQMLIDAGANPDATDDAGLKVAAFVESNVLEGDEKAHGEILRLLSQPAGDATTEHGPANPRPASGNRATMSH